MPTLTYWDFESSDGEAGLVTLDALVSTRDPKVAAAARLEAQAALDWLRAQGLGESGPIDDGARWDAELADRSEAGGWLSLSLTLTLPLDVAQDFEAHFKTED